MAFNSFCLERDVGESQAESTVTEAQSTSTVEKKRGTKNTQTTGVKICPVTQ